MLLKLLASLLTPDPDQVSAQWLKEQERRDFRVEFWSQNISWPIQKVDNERAWRNSHVLRKSA